MGAQASHLEKSPGARQAAPLAKDRRHAGAWLLPTLAGVALGLVSLRPQAPALVWNFTASLPIGLYSVSRLAPAKGDLVAIAPAGTARQMLGLYGALPAGRLLLKQLAAIQGDVVCRTGASITVNGGMIATAKLRSSDGRALPAWGGCRTLGHGEILVLAPHPYSFDSRYFGPISASEIVGGARPLLTLTTEGAS